MKKINGIKIFLVIVLFLSLSFASSLPARALSLSDLFGGRESEFQTTTGFGSNDIYQIIALLIRVVLGFVGIIMVLVVIAAGFKWMTAGGNEDKVSEAKRSLVSAVIGLVIILSAWAIVQFIINSFLDVTNPGP